MVEAASGYLASEPHYLFVASRILAALGGKASLVLVTGDPSADPQPLSQALRKLAGTRHRVIGISCGPELTGEEVSRAGSVVATLPAGGGTVTISDTAETDAPLFVFDEADRLSDQQLGEICTTIQRSARQNAAGVLVARRRFLARLEEPPLQLLREAVALQSHFDEIGDDEGIDFLRHQLAVRHSQDEARRGRPIFFRSLAVLAVLAAIGVGAALALHYVRMPDVKTPDERSAPPAGNPPAGNPAAGNPRGRAIPRRAIPAAIPWWAIPRWAIPAGQSLAERRAATARTPRRAACCRPYADAGAAEAANNTGGAGTCSIAARANAAAKRICRTPRPRSRKRLLRRCNLRRVSSFLRPRSPPW